MLLPAVHIVQQCYTSDDPDLTFEADDPDRVEEVEKQQELLVQLLKAALAPTLLPPSSDTGRLVPLSLTYSAHVLKSLSLSAHRQMPPVQDVQTVACYNLWQSI